MSDTFCIRTARARLVPFTHAHIRAEYIQWLNDPELMRFSNQRFLRHSPESCARYLATFESTDNLFVAVERESDGRLIGTMTVYFDARHGRADVGILIGEPSARGCGFGLEAWIAMMGYLFDVRWVRKITAGAMAENTAMCRLAERAGMQIDGIRRRHNMCEDRAVDVVHYAAFRGEWAPPEPAELGEST